MAAHARHGRAVNRTVEAVTSKSTINSNGSEQSVLGIFTGEGSVTTEENEDSTIYRVVVNHEEQYSIWPVKRENPVGWKDAGKVGVKAECLAYIKEVWTDMRPLSLRKKMEEAKGRR